MSDKRLIEWATPRQIEFIEAVEKYGSERKAASALGISRGTISNSMLALKKRAARSGYSPDHDLTHAVPDGYVLKGASTYYNKHGDKAGQWIKTDIDRDRQEAIMRAAFGAMAKELPRVESIAEPRDTKPDLCNVYTLTDCHVGMLASAKETLDANWDIKIAERTLVSAFLHMVNSAPAAKTGLIAQLGDFLHSDGMLPVTPTHGHILDQDGRFSKIVGAAIRVLRRIVDFALEKHEHVVVLMAEGNHDLASSIWLRAMFKALYENEPRVTVIESELPYYVHQHGETLIAFHHGHMKRNDALPIFFAAQFPKVWGATTKRYAHTGHRHHVEEKEHSGMTVIQHPTIAARDAYAARGGWLSERAAVAITYHARFGQVARTIVTPDMFE